MPNAISPVTRTWRMRRCRGPGVARPPSSNTDRISSRLVSSAGINPKRMLLAREIRSVISSARPSRVTGRHRLKPSMPRRFNPSSAAAANPIPMTPPPKARSMLSVSSCEMIRPRLAPKAIRVAISRRLEADCAISSPATFTQPISRINTTAPHLGNTDERTWSVSARCRETSRISIVAPGGACQRKSCAFRTGCSITITSELASLQVTPGLSRAKTL